MAGASKPTPLGTEPEIRNLNDGTHIRLLTPTPNPVGTPHHAITKTQTIASSAKQTLHKKPVQTKLPVLQQGSQGKDVQKLQQILNARLTPSPQLALDGVFNTPTYQAVIQYQKGIAANVDGIVGKQTWYCLIKGDNVSVPQAIITASPIANPPVQPVVSSVWEWSLADKFTEVLRLTAPKLPSRMRYEFETLLTPVNLSIIVASLVVWAGSHAFGVGEIADIVLLIGGAFYLGMAIFDVAEELGDFIVITSNATDKKELDEAASHLAQVIAIIGVAAFVALLAKVAKGKGGKSAEAVSSETAAVESQIKQRPSNQYAKTPKNDVEIEDPKNTTKMAVMREGAAINFEGTTKVNGEVRDISRTVRQRNDIDWNRVDSETGLTNLELAKKGRPPYWNDGTKMELHHLNQKEPGPMLEIPASLHDKYSKELHGLVENGDSFRNNPVLEKQYNNFRMQYWKWRAKQL